MPGLISGGFNSGTGNPANLAVLHDDSSYAFVRGDVGNAELVSWLLQSCQPEAIVNFAAESHVDRSIVNSHKPLCVPMCWA